MPVKRLVSTSAWFDDSLSISHCHRVLQYVHSRTKNNFASNIFLPVFVNIHKTFDIAHGSTLANVDCFIMTFINDSSEGLMFLVL